MLAHLSTATPSTTSTAIGSTSVSLRGGKDRPQSDPRVPFTQQINTKKTSSGAGLTSHPPSGNRERVLNVGEPRRRRLTLKAGSCPSLARCSSRTSSTAFSQNMSNVGTHEPGQAMEAFPAAGVRKTLTPILSTNRKAERHRAKREGSRSSASSALYGTGEGTNVPSLRPFLLERGSVWYMRIWFTAREVEICGLTLGQVPRNSVGLIPEYGVCPLRHLTAWDEKSIG